MANINEFVNPMSYPRKYFAKRIVKEGPDSLMVVREDRSSVYGVEIAIEGFACSRDVSDEELANTKASDMHIEESLIRNISMQENELGIRNIENHKYKVKNIFFRKNLLSVMIYKISGDWEQTLILTAGYKQRLGNFLAGKPRNGKEIYFWVDQFIEEGVAYLVKNPRYNCQIFISKDLDLEIRENPERAMKQFMVSEEVGMYIYPNSVIRVNAGFRAIYKYYFNLLKEMIKVWWERNDRE